MSIWAYKDTTLYSNGGQSFNLKAEFTEDDLTNEYKLANKSKVKCKATLNCYGNAWSTNYNSRLLIYWHDNRENYDRLYRLIHDEKYAEEKSKILSNN